jgi:hypothetical protein
MVTEQNFLAPLFSASIAQIAGRKDENAEPAYSQCIEAPAWEVCRSVSLAIFAIRIFERVSAALSKRRICND